jgi:hypothetical protein
MLQHFHNNPLRIIGPFVRRNDGRRYKFDELIYGNQSWSMAIARVLMVGRHALELYAMPEHEPLRDFVDWQDGHCGMSYCCTSPADLLQ